jgi:hypothetical protein
MSLGAPLRLGTSQVKILNQPVDYERSAAVKT